MFLALAKLRKMVFVFTMHLLFFEVCYGFDIFPEFHSLSEAEATQFDSTRLIDSEYQSDFVTYMLPLEWDPQFYQERAPFNFSLGSFSNIHFFENSRLKLKQDLSPRLAIKFTYFQQRNLEEDQTHAVLELIQMLTEKISFSIYGEPSLFKRENDLGFAFVLTPSLNHEIRVFHSWIDLTRNEHNDRSDYFLKGAEPESWGLVGRYGGSKTGRSEKRDEKWDWLEYFVRWETPTKWRFPDTSSEYGYEGFCSGFSARYINAVDRKVVTNLRAQVSRKFESSQPVSNSSSIALASLDRRKLETYFSFQIKDISMLGTHVEIEPGLGWFHRKWLNNKDDHLEHRNLTPVLWLRFDGPARNHDSRDIIALGYDSTVFSSSGSASLAANELKSWSVEHRVNFRYSFSFSNHSELNLLVSGDVDSVFRGSGGLFEGGQGQFRTFF